MINRALRASNRDEMLALLAEEPGFKLDYAEIIDEESFQVAGAQTRLRRGIVAGWVNGVRLIDNMPMRSGE